MREKEGKVGGGEEGWARSWGGGGMRGGPRERMGVGRERKRESEKQGERERARAHETKRETEGEGGRKERGRVEPEVFRASGWKFRFEGLGFAPCAGSPRCKRVKIERTRETKMEGGKTLCGPHAESVVCVPFTWLRVRVWSSGCRV